MAMGKREREQYDSADDDALSFLLPLTICPPAVYCGRAAEHTQPRLTMPLGCTTAAAAHEVIKVSQAATVKIQGLSCLASDAFLCVASLFAWSSVLRLCLACPCSDLLGLQ